MSSQARRTVSVIIPVHNAEQYLPACLDSVLAQTLADFELIVVDDGSTDGSYDIMQAYAERDARILIVRQPNRRQGAARNRGLREASGEYVYFLDADDMIAPDLLETCYRACQADSLDFVTFDTSAFAEGEHADQLAEADTIGIHRTSVSTEIMDGVGFWSRYRGDNLPLVCWLEFFNREFLVANELYFEEDIYFEDNDWIVRVFLAACRMRYLARVLHRYRLRRESVTHGSFTPELADSCLRLYGILRDLYDGQKDERRASMVEDVMHIMSYRFDQFRELSANRELAERTFELARSLRVVCENAAAPLELRRSCLWTLARIAKGAGQWQGFPGMPPRELVSSILFADLPCFERDARIGIYGTGLACSLFLDAWEHDGLTLVFFETHPAFGKTFHGEPVIAIDQLPAASLDAVVIANVKHRDEMKACLARYNTGEAPFFTVPREILLFKEAEKA